MKHEWKRLIDSKSPFVGPEFEYATTETLEPPPGEGWVLVSKFGLKVKGGASPSRAS